MERNHDRRTPSPHTGTGAIRMMYSSDLVPGLTGITVELNRTSKDTFLGIDFRGYLQGTMAAFREMPPAPSRQVSIRDLPERIFQVLTTREYCYLSADRIATYKKELERQISDAVATNRPIRFFYDIGGGFHSTLSPTEGPASHEVGLGELLILFQIRTFVSKVKQLYQPGATFTLVIDNLCAAMVNNLKIPGTVDYCTKLRELIVDTGLSGVVELLVESELFTLADFAGARVAGASDRARFSTEVSKTSERLLSSRIDGIQVTQRASPTTICFRPFPGGDSRIQGGEVGLFADALQKIRPVLLTSRNVSEYTIQRESPYTFLPPAIRHLNFAKAFLGR
jgi:hypothetical protein